MPLPTVGHAPYFKYHFTLKSNTSLQLEKYKIKHIPKIKSWKSKI